MVSSYIAHIQCSVRFTHITLVTGPVHSCTISTPLLEHTALAAISDLGTSRTHCHLCPTRYSFTPESSEACEGKVSCPRTQHRNNIPILRGEKHDISLKILHQAGFETARQAVTLANLRALAIAPRPSLEVIRLLEVRENYSYLFNFRPNIFKSWCVSAHFIPTNIDLIGW